MQKLKNNIYTKEPIEEFCTSEEWQKIAKKHNIDTSSYAFEKNWKIYFNIDELCVRKKDMSGIEYKFFLEKLTMHEYAHRLFSMMTVWINENQHSSITNILANNTNTSLDIVNEIFAELSESLVTNKYNRGNISRITISQICKILWYHNIESPLDIILVWATHAELNTNLSAAAMAKKSVTLHSIQYINKDAQTLRLELFSQFKNLTNTQKRSCIRMVAQRSIDDAFALMQIRKRNIYLRKPWELVKLLFHKHHLFDSVSKSWRENIWKTFSIDIPEWETENKRNKKTHINYDNIEDNELSVEQKREIQQKTLMIGEVFSDISNSISERRSFKLPWDLTNTILSMYYLQFEESFKNLRKEHTYIDTSFYTVEQQLADIAISSKRKNTTKEREKLKNQIHKVWQQYPSKSKNIISYDAKEIWDQFVYTDNAGNICKLAKTDYITTYRSNELYYIGVIDGKYWIIDNTWQRIYAPIYDGVDTIRHTQDWFFIVKNMRSYWIIDKSGKEIIPCKYNSISSNENWFSLYLWNGFQSFMPLDQIGNHNKLKSFEDIDELCKIIWNTWYMIAKEKKLYWVYSIHWELIIEAIYEKIKEIWKDLFIYTTNKQEWGGLHEGPFWFMDIDGKKITDELYTEILREANGYIRAYKNNLCWIYDSNAKEILPCIYDKVCLWEKNILVEKENKVYTYNIEDKKFIEQKYSIIHKDDEWRIGLRFWRSSLKSIVVCLDGRYWVVDIDNPEAEIQLISDIPFESIKRNNTTSYYMTYQENMFWEELYWIIDENWNEITKPIYQSISHLYSGEKTIFTISWEWNSRRLVAWFINVEDKIVVDPQFDNMNIMETKQEYLFLVNDDNRKTRVINTETWRFVCKKGYDSIQEIDTWDFITTKRIKWIDWERSTKFGIISPTWEEILPCIYDKILVYWSKRVTKLWEDIMVYDATEYEDTIDLPHTIKDIENVKDFLLSQSSDTAYRESFFANSMAVERRKHYLKNEKMNYWTDILEPDIYKTLVEDIYQNIQDEDWNLSAISFLAKRVTIPPKVQLKTNNHRYNQEKDEKRILWTFSEKISGYFIEQKWKQVAIESDIKENDVEIDAPWLQLIWAQYLQSWTKIYVRWHSFPINTFPFVTKQVLDSMQKNINQSEKRKYKESLVPSMLLILASYEHSSFEEKIVWVTKIIEDFFHYDEEEYWTIQHTTLTDILDFSQQHAIKSWIAKPYAGICYEAAKLRHACLTVLDIPSGISNWYLAKNQTELINSSDPTKSSAHSFNHIDIPIFEWKSHRFYFDSSTWWDSSFNGNLQFLNQEETEILFEETQKPSQATLTNNNSTYYQHNEIIAKLDKIYVDALHDNIKYTKQSFLKTMQQRKHNNLTYTDIINIQNTYFIQKGTPERHILQIYFISPDEVIRFVQNTINKTQEINT